MKHVQTLLQLSPGKFSCVCWSCSFPSRNIVGTSCGILINSKEGSCSFCLSLEIKPMILCLILCWEPKLSSCHFDSHPQNGNKKLKHIENPAFGGTARCTVPWPLTFQQRLPNFDISTTHKACNSALCVRLLVAKLHCERCGDEWTPSSPFSSWVVCSSAPLSRKVAPWSCHTWLCWFKVFLEIFWGSCVKISENPSKIQFQTHGYHDLLMTYFFLVF